MRLVVKPGKVRLCLDSRKLNSVTIKDAYPFQSINRIFARLPKANVITKLDLNKKRCILAKRFIGKVRATTAFVICIVSENFETNLSILVRVADKLRQANLTLNLRKSKFCVTETTYLGFILGNGGIATFPKKKNFHIKLAFLFIIISNKHCINKQVTYCSSFIYTVNILIYIFEANTPSHSS